MTVPNNTQTNASHLFTVDQGVYTTSDKEIYNPAIVSTPYGLDVFARYETNSKENDSHIVLGSGSFVDDILHVSIYNNGKILEHHQDPFHCGQFTDSKNGSKYQVFGAVKIHVDTDGAIPIQGWDTRLFRYDSQSILHEIKAGRKFEPFFIGPRGMKGIRPIELSDGTVGCFVRPQGAFGGNGRIGFIRTKSLDELPEAINNFVETKDESLFVHGLTRPDIGQWGGVNRVVANSNGTLTLSYHVAYFLKDHGKDTKVKRYEAWAAIFDPYTSETIEAWQVAASDTHFGGHNIRAKNSDLEGGILYPDSFYQKNDGELYLITGIGDTTMGATHIDSSNFAKYGALNYSAA